MSKVVFAHLPTVGGKLREEYIAKLSAISDYSKAKEPDVVTYAVMLPRDESDTKTVYMLEAYKDQAAFDTHMASDVVQDMIKWMGAVPVLEGAPRVSMLDVIDDFGLFSRPDALDQTTDPYVVVGEVTYKDAGLLNKSLPYWAKVVATTKAQEPGSLVYTLTRDATKPEQLVTVEAYTNEEYLWDVHVKSDAVQANVTDTKDWRADLKLNHLKKVHGFLAKAKI